ncbi:MAG: hypothetical protein AB1673_09770 [Actinomycetota bacterium]
MAATALALAISRRGVYTSPDALAYLGTAANLAGGDGFTPPPGSPPVANFPPLFTLLVAAFSSLGPSPFTVVQVLNPVLGGLVVLAVGVGVHRLTRALGLAVAAQVLVAAGLDFLAFTTSGLSEPLFVLLAVLTAAALATASSPARTGQRSALLAVAALLAGAACLTRYVGIALVAGGALALMVARHPGRRPRPAEPAGDESAVGGPADGGAVGGPADGGAASGPADGGAASGPADGGAASGPADGGAASGPADGGAASGAAEGAEPTARLTLRARLLGAAAFAAIALAPLAGWLAWAGGTGGQVVNRTAGWHPPGLDWFAAGARTASAWFVPAEVPEVARLAGAVLIVTALAVAAVRAGVRDRNGPGRPAQAPPHETCAGTVGVSPTVPAQVSVVVALTAVLAAAYVGVLVANRAVFEVTGRLDQRFLFPVHMAAVVMAALALSRTAGARLARAALVVVVAGQVASGAAWSWDALRDPEVRPGGFTSPAFASSAGTEAVRALSLSQPVYTNQVDALWHHTGRVATLLPEKSDFYSGRPNPRYEAELAAMAQRLHAGGLVVYFTRPPSRLVALPTPQELADALGLVLVDQDAVGAVYRAPTPASRPGPGG